MVAAQGEEHQHQQPVTTTTNTIKGKRTKRPRPSSPLPLVALPTASNNSSPDSLATSSSVTEEEEDMAHCLILLAQGGNTNKSTQLSPSPSPPLPIRTAAVEPYSYECKTCNRCFPSFQALGGHRASHKKPKITPDSSHLLEQQLVQGQINTFQLSTATADDTIEAGSAALSLQIPTTHTNHAFGICPITSSNNKPKVHECTICGAEFSSGQALGGHMRRHRPLVSSSSKLPIAVPRSTTAFLCLDLNLAPASDPEEDSTQLSLQHHSDPNNFVFPSNENTLVFSATTSLVDCHY